MESIRIITPRLVLREFTLADAADVQRLAGDWQVAKTTLAIPHPYPDGAAEAWIATHPRRITEKQGLVVALTLNGQLIGCVGIERYAQEPARAELGYWIGTEWWGRGYCTEAVRAIFSELPRFLPGVKEVVAHYMRENPASGRVMEKAGMKSVDPHRKEFGGRCAGKAVGCYALEISE